MRGLRRILSLAGFGILGSCVPEAQPAVGVVYVERSPPPRLAEVVGMPPQQGVTWMSGHWRWNGAEFYWVPGQWVAVRPGYRTWVPERWMKTRRGWYFIEGHWR
ncbi:MAG: YXWGXW repeat-containing protein [Gemmatimonadales bacterium]